MVGLGEEDFASLSPQRSKTSLICQIVLRLVTVSKIIWMSNMSSRISMIYQKDLHVLKGVLSLGEQARLYFVQSVLWIRLM